MSVPASVIIVLTLSNGLGCVVRGISGFGSAIINLAVWILFKNMGVNPGTLSQAVVTEAISSSVVSIPLAVLTRAHRTADIRLVVALVIFVFLVASLLVAVICVQAELFSDDSRKRAAAWLNKLRRRGRAGGGQAFAKVPEDQQQLKQASTVSLAAGGAQLAAANPFAAALEPPGEGPVLTPAKPVASIGIAIDARAGEADAAPLLAGAGGGSSGGCGGSNAQAGAQMPAAPSPSFVDGLAVPAYMPSRGAALGSGGELTAAALRDEDAAAVANAAPSAAALPLGRQGSTPPSAASAPFAAPSGNSAAADNKDGEQRVVWNPDTQLNRWLARFIPHERARSWAEVLLLGSVAGTLGGVMAGMTGIGGPPIMYLYHVLDVPKDVVRGTGAVNSILQLRIVSYVAMGLITRSEWPLYLSTGASGLAGVVAGNWAAKFVDQAMFRRFLLLLMITCCALLYASAAGLAKDDDNGGGGDAQRGTAE